jgi:hypothetical protein
MSLFPLGLLSQGGGAAAGDFELISTTLLTSSAASVAFTSIPATYKHLQIRATVRSDRALGIDTLTMRFNSDSSANYWTHGMYGNGSAASVLALGANSSIYAGRTTDSLNTASAFAPNIIDILDYLSTNKNKTIRCLFGADTVGSYPWQGIHSGSWGSTAAITAIDILPITGPNFVSGSRFSLYGIKG